MDLLVFPAKSIAVTSIRTVFPISSQVTLFLLNKTSLIEQLSETEFNLVVSGIIEPEWHVYSQFTPDGGPLPMVLEFKNSKGNYELIGKPKESKYKKQFNDVFEVDEFHFNDFIAQGIVEEVKEVEEEVKGQSTSGWFFMVKK